MSKTPIFIGGISHSGTSILRKCIKEHPDITGMEAELRFICDPDGLADALDDLSTNWSRHRGDRAVARLNVLLRLFSGKQTRGAYKTKNFEEWLDPRYLHRVRTLINTLTVEDVNTYHRGYDTGDGTVITERWDREGLATKFGTFVRQLYHERDPEATHFVEDTPENLTHEPYLREMFPDRKFIMIVRHPMDVMESLYKTGNAYGNDPVALAKRNRDRMAMWEENVPNINNFWTVKFEKFVQDHHRVMKELFTRYFDVPWTEEVLDNRMDPNRAHLNRYNGFFADEFGEGIEHRIQEILEPIAEVYGYDFQSY